MPNTTNSKVTDEPELEQGLIKDQHAEQIKELYERGWRWSSVADYCRHIIKNSGPNMPELPVLLKEGVILAPVRHDMLVKVSPVVIYLDQALESISSGTDYFIDEDIAKIFALDAYVEKRLEPFAIPYNRFGEDSFTVWALGGEGSDGEKSAKAEKFGQMLHKSRARIDEIVVFPSGKGGTVDRCAVSGVWAEKDGHMIRLDYFRGISEHPLRVRLHRAVRPNLTYDQVTGAYKEYIQLLRIADPDNVKGIDSVLNKLL